MASERRSVFDKRRLVCERVRARTWVGGPNPLGHLWSWRVGLSGSGTRPPTIRPLPRPPPARVSPATARGRPGTVWCPDAARPLTQAVTPFPRPPAGRSGSGVMINFALVFRERFLDHPDDVICVPDNLVSAYAIPRQVMKSCTVI